MTDKEILQKAIKIAMKNGWLPPSFSVREVFDEWWEKNKSFHNYYKLIFDPAFAKALWGEEDFDGFFISKELVMKECPRFEDNPLKEWQYHAQQMVISPDKLKYLEKNI